MAKQMTVAIIGCGARGKDTYAIAQEKIPEKMKIVAAADLIKEKVEEVAKRYNVPLENCFLSGEDLLEQPKLANIAFICTQDKQHVGHAIKALKKGYHLLLEKPISPDLNECNELLRVAKECNKKVIVCHVLRYTPFYKKIKEIIDSGVLGEIITIQAIENVGYWHTAHSFVRGNWRREDETSPMILAKCCHDMDLLLWLTGKHCKRVSSFGNTMVFKVDKAPKGATKYCLDGCLVKDSCPYDAEKIYVTNEITGVVGGNNTNWPCNILTLNPTYESIMNAIKEGPYGRCVYFCDNDVVDHQTINIELENGCTIDFNMSGFTSKTQRYIKIMGTHGDLEADMNTNLINLCEYGKPHEIIDVSKLTSDFFGHGGGDHRMVEELIDLLNGKEPSSSLSSLDVSVESHYVALAAELSRKQKGKPIDINDIKK